jgi:Holliday junction resolvase RusA-like endonuclease
MRPGRKPRDRKGRTGFDIQAEQKASIANYVRGLMSRNGWKIFTGPTEVYFHFLLPIPKYASRRVKAILEAGGIAWVVTSPDNSNFLKFYEDALNKVLWTDDRILCCEHEFKIYSLKPKTIIEVRAL